MNYEAMMDNPFTQPEALFQLIFNEAEAHADMLESVFDDVMIASNRLPVDGRMQLRIYLDQISAEDVQRRMTIAESMLGVALSLPQMLAVETKDWVSEVQRQFQPMEVGRFYVHGSHHVAHEDVTKHSIVMDAGAAFGTGEHATTAGCLAMIDRLAMEGFAPARGCDMGCGTAILAIAAAKMWPEIWMVAAEIDPVAVPVAQENVERNVVQAQCVVTQSDGYAAMAVQEHSPYDLIIANILANPLIMMAGDLAQHLAPGGYAILSGLLAHQAEEVIAAHVQAGLTFCNQTVQENWAVLLMQKPR